MPVLVVVLVTGLSMRHHVILNPTSGGGAGRKLRPEIERELAARGLTFTLEETERPWHAAELAQAAARAGVDVVVAAGGDGTIHEVANGLLAAAAGGEGDPALGVIPVGTGNDFAKLLVGGKDRRQAYQALAAGDVAVFDVGHVSWSAGASAGGAAAPAAPGAGDGQIGAEYFINGMGTGVDVEVVRQIHRLPHMPAILLYLIGLIRAVIGFKAIPLRIRADDRPLDRPVMIIAIGNGPCLGGGFWVCPHARPDDGRFDICMVDDLNYFQIARTIPRVMRGTHEHLAVVTMDQARTIEVETVGAGAAPLFFQLDGELREPADARRMRIALRPGALRVVGGRVTRGDGAAARPAEGRA